MAEQAADDKDFDAGDLVIEKDTGARDPHGPARYVLLGTALLWSLFQLWISSPLPFEFNIFIFNDTESRAIHLAFAIFLAFTAYPAFSNSPRHHIPILDWIMALAAAYCASYLFFEYEALARRPGLPTQTDIIVACVGMALLFEAARRSLGLPLPIIAGVFLFYTFFGNLSWMPDLIQHGGHSLNKTASQQWLTTEGVFGIALGVSTSFVFLFVLFGSLLDKAGAGNYFIKVAFSLLGHLRGGPAKAAVLASGLTGFISGSSIANVVTTGTFTIPLMKRVGFSSEKAGAVEVASSVNGQIMPPVMGAAAFLMVEYVGISYGEVVKHAFIPAIISYIALLYIVHLEALKSEMQGLPKPITSTLKQKLIGYGIIITSLLIFSGVVFYGMQLLREAMGESSVYVVVAGLIGLFFYLIFYASKYPDLEQDDPNAEVVELPETGPTVKTGLHYLIPVVVLVWCLMIDRLSPGLSAFWATTVMIVILLTQRPLLCLFRKQKQLKVAFIAGWNQLIDGLIAGARNMIGIGIATAAAGIIVGCVTQTGIGQIMTEVVEALSGGSLIMVLIFTAVISLILGMGLPTTANYIVVSSIMVGVVQELGAQHGLLVPAIAIHLFVFYFGIMADVTPPVGLASFAAAAVSKGDPIRTGVQAFVYSTRTAILPFFFIFNTSLLLIGVDSFIVGFGVFITATIAILAFSSAIQNYTLVQNKLHESALLLAASIMLFIPQVVMNQVSPAYEEVPGMMLEEVVMQAQPGDMIAIEIHGEDLIGDPKQMYVNMPIGEGQTAATRMQAFGITVNEFDGKAMIDEVMFNSAADKAKVFFDDEVAGVRKPIAQPDPRLLYIPAILMILLVLAVQNRRKKA